VLGRLIRAPADDVILANSASYGLHLLANGIPWRPGDEVLLMRTDFPSCILPWLGLEDRGVRVRYIQPRERVIQPDELAASISPSTRLLCATWVHSLSGYAVDLHGLGQVCRKYGVIFVANCSQAVGARPLNVSDTPVDAITSVGFKWLCGPYGTGFCWMRPELRETLEYNQAYWLSMQTADDLGKENAVPALRTDLGARQYDVFGTANFFNYKPWTASIEYVLKKGVDRIRDYDQRLVSRFIAGLDRDTYELLSPEEEGDRRSTLIFISHKQRDRNKQVYDSLRERGVYVAYRAGSLRIAPHLYNTDADIDRALSALNDGI
jgi:selenocysteine lyase/cysteine desulfurase